MLEALTLDQPPAIEAKRRGGSSRPDRNRTRSAYAIGAIVLLGDGTRCRVELIDQHGTAWCRPITETDR